MFDLIHEIGQTMRNNKLRTGLTGFAVAWGIFMLILLLGMSRGLYNSVNENMGDNFANSMTVWGGITTKPYKGYQERRRINLHNDDMAALHDDNPSIVEDVTAIKSIWNVTITGPHDYISGSLSGLFPQMKSRYASEIIEGRFINDRDIAEKRKSMVLSQRNAELLFGAGNSALGKTVDCMGLSWKVVGIFKARWGSNTYIPYTTAMMLTGNDGQVGELHVTVKGLETEDDGVKAENQIRKTLAREHKFDPDDSGGVWIWNRFSTYLANKASLGYLNIAVWVIGIFTLLSGIVGVSNIMFVSVRERTHEIGIRRAIGAKPRNILTQVVLESVAITTIFGYIGVFMGMVILQIADHILASSGESPIKNPTVDISIAIQVTVLLVIAGCIAGFFPAIKATKVKPVEALRDE